MGASANTEYCALSKVVEHPGDRWSVLMARQLAMFGARGFTEPELCLEDPPLSQEPYVYVEANAADRYRVARGIRSRTDALIDGSVRVFGEPEYVGALPDWFLQGPEPHRQPDPNGRKTSDAPLEWHAARVPGG